jgi:hypothetical protein
MFSHLSPLSTCVVFSFLHKPLNKLIDIEIIAFGVGKTSTERELA